MPVAYYNENDEFAAAWLRELIAGGHIAYGVVDTRSICDVRPDDLAGFTQCHFFAGIGGWSYALRLAEWPDDRPVWTGSCPCQPFSTAGKQKGFDDERHLWPVWAKLIAERKPATIFGEQVASAKLWLDGVYADLENQNYAVGAAVLPACSVDAPHRRDRLWFVADTLRTRSLSCTSTGIYRTKTCPGSRHVELKRPSDGTLADTNGSNGYWWSGPLQVGRNTIEGKITASGDFRGTQWRIKPGISLLAHGIQNRVAKLRGFGNAIVPQVAEKFIRSYLDVTA
jgi:DNA (cytosine-5)-methyltransferase 1